mgnify:FL=1
MVLLKRCGMMKGMRMIDTTSVESILRTVRTVFPEAESNEDSSRQIIIYTGLYQVGDEEVPLVTYDEYIKEDE